MDVVSGNQFETEEVSGIQWKLIFVILGQREVVVLVEIVGISLSQRKLVVFHGR